MDSSSRERKEKGVLFPVFQYELKQVRIKDLKVGDIVTIGNQFYKLRDVEDGAYRLSKHYTDYYREMRFWHPTQNILRANSNQFVMQVMDYDL